MWNTTAVSLIASCQLHEVEPWAYLRDVLTLLPSWPKADVLALAPKNWAATLAKSETQARLAELRLLERALAAEQAAARVAEAVAAEGARAA